MRALLLTSDSWLASDLSRDLGSQPEPVTVTVASQSHDLLDRLPMPDIDALLVHVAPGDVATSVGVIERARAHAPDLPIVAVLDREGVGAAEAVTAGASGFVHAGPRAAEATVALIRGIQGRPPLDRHERYRVLFVTRTDGFRESTLAERFDLETVGLLPDEEQWATALSPDGRPFDAIVIDGATVGAEILDVVQLVVTFAANTPIVALTDAGDRRLATAALQLGVQQVISKSGAWPVRVTAAIEFGVAAFAAMTELRDRRASEARLRAFVDALPLGLVVLDEEGAMLAINPRASELTGIDINTTRSRPRVFDFVVDDDHELVRALLRRVTGGGRSSALVRWLSPDAPCWLQIDAAPFTRPGAVPNVLAAMRPVPDVEGEAEHLRTQRDEAVAALERAQQAQVLETTAHARELDFARDALWKAEESRFGREERIRELEEALSRARALEDGVAMPRDDAEVDRKPDAAASTDAAAGTGSDDGHAADEWPAAAEALPGVVRLAASFVREMARHAALVRRAALDLLESVHDESARVELKRIASRASRAQAVARQFVDFSRSRFRRPRPVPLADVFETLKPSMLRAVGSPVHLEIDPPQPPSVTVLATREGLGRVLMWVLGAASEALPFGGAITISAVELRPATSGSQPTLETAGHAAAAADTPDVESGASGTRAAASSHRAGPTTRGTVRVRVVATGFQQDALRASAPIEPLLTAWGASIDVVQRDRDRAWYELVFRC